MTKKRGSRQKACRVNGPEEAINNHATQDDPLVTDDDPFECLIDELYEKRSATRCHGMDGIVRLLCSSFYHDECVARETTLVRFFLSSLRRGSTVEALLAARGLGLLIVTLGLGDEAERVWEESRDLLIKTASSKQKGTETRCAAVESYALACFIAESDPLVTLDAMGLLSSLWSTEAHSVREAAIRGWTLLLSTLSAGLVDDIFDEGVDKLIALLEDNAVDVRRASGEAVALLHGLGVELDADDMDYSDGNSSVASNSTGLSRMSGIEYAMDKMKDLAGPKGQIKKRSKKDRAALRSTFRDVCNFVEEGIVQESKIKLKGAILVIDDLAGLIQLNFVRKALGGGFQAHLQNNELLHQIFQYSPGEGQVPKLTKAEKRMLKSPQSTANRLRTKERKYGYTAKMAMLQGVC